MAIHAAMVDRMDREVGRILAKLDEAGHRDDTLILFASDNGATPGGTRRPQGRGTPRGVPGRRPNPRACRERRVAAGGRGGQEDAVPAVLQLAQPAAPLAAHAARVGAGLGEGAGVEDQDALLVAQLLDDVASDLGHDRLVVPLAGAGEGLDGLAMEPGLDGDRLAGLALQAAAQAAEDEPGMGARVGLGHPRAPASSEASIGRAGRDLGLRPSGVNRTSQAPADRTVTPPPRNTAPGSARSSSRSPAPGRRRRRRPPSVRVSPRSARCSSAR